MLGRLETAVSHTLLRLIQSSDSEYQQRSGKSTFLSALLVFQIELLALVLKLSYEIEGTELYQQLMKPPKKCLGLCYLCP